MTGSLNMSNNKINNVSDPTSAQDVATKNYVDSNTVTKVNKAGDTMTGSLNMNTYKITNLGDPTLAHDAATKNYIDALGSPIYMVVTGTIPTTLGSNITIYTLPANKTIANGKIMIVGLWVETHLVIGLNLIQHILQVSLLALKCLPEAPVSYCFRRTLLQQGGVEPSSFTF